MNRTERQRQKRAFARQYRTAVSNRLRLLLLPAGLFGLEIAKIEGRHVIKFLQGNAYFKIVWTQNQLRFVVDILTKELLGEEETLEIVSGSGLVVANRMPVAPSA